MTTAALANRWRFRVFVTPWECTHDHGSAANAGHRFESLDMEYGIFIS